jgi:hypothetical protein
MSSDAESGADDVVEQDDRRFPFLNGHLSRGAAILGAAGLVAGLVVGYAAGDRHAGNRSASYPGSSASPAPPPRHSTSSQAAAAAVLSSALAQSTAACSVQHGRDLQLGVQVTNRSGDDLTLGEIRPVFPVGGLKAVSQRWAPCGALPAGPDQSSTDLPPGASAWLTVTVKVLNGCPSASPVQFIVVYDWNGQPKAEGLPGFSDLTNVPYTGCPAN